MLTPQSGPGPIRFAVTTNSSNAEVSLVGPAAFPIGQETHVVVTYDFIAGTSALYLNGQIVTNSIASVPLGGINDVNVWLGKSQWGDPYLNGQFDEFRIYNGIVSDSAIAASFRFRPRCTHRAHTAIESRRGRKFRHSVMARKRPRLHVAIHHQPATGIQSGQRS